MHLLPDEIRAQLPLLDSQDSKGDAAIAYVKFFTPGFPTGHGTPPSSMAKTCSLVWCKGLRKNSVTSA